MADAEATKGALELGESVAVAGFAGLVSEETQAIGVEVVRESVGKENFPDMGEMGEGCLGLDEGRSDDETGGVVDCRGEGCLYEFEGQAMEKLFVSSGH